jgi:hypothetical protein
MVVEIIPRPISKTPLWQDILFYFSIALFLGSILVFFALNHFQQKATAELDSVKKLIIEHEAASGIGSLEKEVLTYQKKIGDFSNLFESHRLSSSVFPFIESLTHPQVVWTGFNLDTEASVVLLSGQTQNFQTLGQQISILKGEELISSLDLSDVKLGKEGKVDFKLKLSLNPEILK